MPYINISQLVGLDHELGLRNNNSVTQNSIIQKLSCIVKTGLLLMVPCNHIYYIRTTLFYIIILIKPYQKLLHSYKFLRISVNDYNYSEVINCKNTVLGKNGTLLVLCLTYLSTWKIDVMCSSKMLDFLQTTQFYNSEDHALLSLLNISMGSLYYVSCKKQLF